MAVIAICSPWLCGGSKAVQRVIQDVLDPSTQLVDVLVTLLQVFYVLETVRRAVRKR